MLSALENVVQDCHAADKHSGSRLHAILPQPQHLSFDTCTSTEHTHQSPDQSQHMLNACRFKEATHRTTRWIDRCIAAHSRPQEQNLFGIVQGGLDRGLRDISIRVGALTCLLGGARPCRQRKESCSHTPQENFIKRSQPGCKLLFPTRDKTGWLVLAHHRDLSGLHACWFSLCHLAARPLNKLQQVQPERPDRSPCMPHARRTCQSGACLAMQ